MLLIGGYFWGLGIVDFYAVFFSYFLGTVTSSFMLFMIGEWKGQKLLDTGFVQRFFPHDQQEKAKNSMKKMGIFTLVLCKFIPGINSITIILTGIMKYNKTRGMILITIAAIIHDPVFFFVGRTLGSNWGAIENFLRTFNIGAVIVVSILICFYIAYKLISKQIKTKRERSKTLSPNGKSEGVLTMDYRSEYKVWTDSIKDAGVLAELSDIKDNDDELEDRFYKYLDFGTAGMRGIIGAGNNRMNIYMVRRATQGLAEHLSSGKAHQAGVVIAYDSRNFSEAFAQEAACVLAANGIKTYLYESLRSVPQLSFTVRKLGCAAGVVITASHNPKQYNGYKVYGADGGQLPPDASEELTKTINGVDAFNGIKRMTIEEALAGGILKIIGKELDEEYFKQVLGLCKNPELIKNIGDSFKIVYTPLHGTGNIPVRRVLGDIGLKNVYIVAEQESPNGDFPTVKAPNPEERDVYDLAIKLADEKGADVIIATDPDCDRLGVAVRGPDGSFEVLTGNQIACLMLQYVLEQTQVKPGDFAVKSIVSTDMADIICKGYGAEMVSVLTGFRFIAEAIQNHIEAVEAGKAKGSFLFGFEESYGYLMGDFVRDKDACIASMLLAETAAWHASRGKTLYEGLRELYERFGWFKESVRSYTFAGIDGLKRIDRIMDTLRNVPQNEFAGLKVIAVRDYSSGKRVAGGAIENLTLPNSNVLYFELEGNARVIVRPSGTEPKLKSYITVCAGTESESEALLDNLSAEFHTIIQDI